MANFNFYCRPSKMDKNGYSPIELSIALNGKRCFIQLPRKEKPDEFSKLMSSKKPSDMKDYIAIMRVRINEAITELCLLHKTLTVDTLKNLLVSGGTSSYTIEDLFDECLSIVKDKVTDLNYSKYCLVRDEFYKHINKSNEVSSITNAVIQTFYNKLQKKYKSSTTAGKMAKLKFVIRFAFDNGKITVNPFSTIRISKPRPVIEYLTDEEVQKIIDKELPCERLIYIRDLFLFQCGSGLAFSDMYNLVPTDVTKENNVHIIIKPRQKTDIIYTSVLLPWAVMVWEKYKGHLPKISNQKLNAYLKELGDICGIHKSLHSHIARKTYCTHLLNSGCRIEVVSKCAGHSNTKVTAAIYAHLQTKTIVNEVTKVIYQGNAQNGLSKSE